MIKLTREQADEAERNPNGVECQADGSERTFMIVDADVLRQMEDAIARNDHAAIQAGIDDMQAGRMQPAAEAHRHGREEIIARFRQ